MLSLMVGWFEFNVPFQHKYGYTRDEVIINKRIGSNKRLADGSQRKQKNKNTVQLQ